MCGQSPHVASLELVDFGLHHHRVVVDGGEGDLVGVLSVSSLQEVSKPALSESD